MQFYGAFERFGVWFWRRIEKIIGRNHAKKREVLQRAKEERNFIHKEHEGYLNVIYCVGTVFQDTSRKNNMRGKRKRKELLNDIREMRS